MSDWYSARYWSGDRDHATSLHTTDRPEAGALSTGIGVSDEGMVVDAGATTWAAVTDRPLMSGTPPAEASPELAFITVCHTAANCGKKLSCSMNANVSSLNIGPLTSVPSANTSG